MKVTANPGLLAEHSCLRLLLLSCCCCLLSPAAVLLLQVVAMKQEIKDFLTSKNVPWEEVRRVLGCGESL